MRRHEIWNMKHEEKRRVKLISLNIERDQHYETALPFLKREQADVVCLMEILDRDVARFKRELGMDCLFAPTAVADRGRGAEALAKAGVRMGTALFSRLPLTDCRTLYYYGTPEHLPSVKDAVPPDRHESYNGILLVARAQSGEDAFTIGTTHFTWTPDGGVSEGQRKDVKALLALLEQFPDIVFCGDFNAPRGKEIWNTVAARYQDNVPLEYETSIDQELHAVTGIQYVVDGLFSTPHYQCADTKLVCGVSDHCAIVSTILRVRQ